MIDKLMRVVTVTGKLICPHSGCMEAIVSQVLVTSQLLKHIWDLIHLQLY